MGAKTWTLRVAGLKHLRLSVLWISRTAHRMSNSVVGDKCRMEPGDDGGECENRNILATIPGFRSIVLALLSGKHVWKTGPKVTKAKDEVDERIGNTLADGMAMARICCG